MRSAGYSWCKTALNVHVLFTVTVFSQPVLVYVTRLKCLIEKQMTSNLTATDLKPIKRERLTLQNTKI